MVRHVLSIDGGGIRGIIPALILAEIEKRANKALVEMFDLLTGTGTGGIVVAGLCKKDAKGEYRHSVANVVEMYRKKATEIFSSSLGRELKSMCCGALYPANTLEDALHHYFGDDTLGSVPTNLLITSYDMNLCQPIMFKSWKTKDIKIKDAVRASTASPTFFEPKQLTVDNVERCLVDGGVIANNPSACAYASAKRLFPKDDISILSIGCGRKCEHVACGSARHWGKVGWVVPIIELLMNAGSDCVGYQLKQIIGEKFVRIEPQLDNTSIAIDDTSKKNLEAMVEDVKNTIHYYDKMIETFLKQFK